MTTYESSTDNGFQEFVGLRDVGERVVLQLRLAVENGRVAGSREERVAEVDLICENSGVGHVVGELAASLVKVLAFREERLLVSSTGAIGDRSTRVEVRKFSHSMQGKERVGLTRMREGVGVL